MTIKLSFETDTFSGWTTFGSASIVTTTDGVSATDGTYFAYLNNNDPAGTESALESFLGVSSGSLATLGYGTPTDGSAIETTLTVNAGDVITFNWDFVTHDYSPYDDFSFVTFNNQAYGLAGIQDVGSYGTTGWKTFTYTATATGTLKIGLGVVNTQDTAVNSDLLIDNLQVAPVAPQVKISLQSDTGYSQTDHITSNPTVTGTGDANAVVHFEIDGSSITATATADASGTWTFAPTGLSDGVHTIKATETNANGYTGTASLSFTLDTDAPVITNGAHQYIIPANAQAAVQPFNYPWSGTTVTDADASETEHVTLTLSNPQGGTLTKLGAGSYDAATGVYTVSGSAAAVTSAIQGLTFNPAFTVPVGQLSTESFALSVTNDSQTATATTTYTADADLLISGLSTQTTGLGDTIHPFANAQVQTADPNQQYTIWIYNGLNGTYALPPSADYSGQEGQYISGTAAGLTEALHNLTYTALSDPSAYYWSLGSSPAVTYYDPAVSNWVSTVGLDIEVAAPFIKGTGSVATTDEAAVHPFAKATITDSVAGLTESMTVTLSNAQNGTLGNLAGGSYDAASGVYTVSGSTSQVTAALEGLVFTPTLGQVPGGQQVTTGFTVSVNDGYSSQSDNQSSVVATSVMPPAVTAQLFSDTGSSGSDGITSNPAVKGTGNPNATVTITEDGNTLGTTTADLSGNWTYTPSALADGAHTLVASEADAAVKVGSTSLSFMLDTVAPVVTEGLVKDTGASSDAITSNPAVQGGGDPNATVNLTVDGEAATMTADAQGSWSYTPTGLADGQHTIVASETDAAGNTASTTLNFALDTTAPTVSASESVSGWTNSTSDTITVTASDAGSGVASVEVYDTANGVTTDLGTAIQGSDGNWRLIASNLADGSHAFTAVATDVAGNASAAVSAGAADQVDTAAPTITIDPLGSNSTINLATAQSGFTITGTATDSGSGVKQVRLSFINNAAYQNELEYYTTVSNGTWSVNIPGGAMTNLLNGGYTVYAQSYDNVGNTNWLYGPQMTLDTIPPSVTEALLKDTGSSSSDGITSNPAIQGTGNPNATVNLTVDGQAVTTIADGSGNWTYTPAGFVDGPHTVAASETDAAGNTGSASLSFTLDTTPPSVTEALVKDTGSSSSDGISSNPAIQGTGDPNATVNLTVDGQATTASADPTGKWTYAPSGLADGLHTVVASETDAAGNTGSATFSFTLDTTPPAAPPTPSDSAVANGYVNAAGDTSTQALTGTAEAGSTVTVYDGSAKLGTVVAGSTGAWSYALGTLADGSAHSYAVTATDAAGNTSDMSQPLAFKLDITPPVAPSRPMLGDARGSGFANAANVVSTANPSFTGTAEANSLVRIYDGSTQIGIGQADAKGKWVITTSQLSAGSHSLTATATDAAGNTSALSAATQVTAYSPTTTLLASLTGSTNLELGDQSAIVANLYGDEFVIGGNGNNYIGVAGPATSTHTLSLGNGNNTVLVYSGSNQLTLGTGTDQVMLYGGTSMVNLGAGSYTFTESGGAVDTLMFSSPNAMVNTPLGTSDRLVFSNAGFDLAIDNGKGTATPQAIDASLFSTHTDGTFASTANRFAYDQKTGNLWYDADGSGTASSAKIVADLTNKPHPSAASVEASLFFAS